jgi:hypothetical protein
MKRSDAFLVRVWMQSAPSRLGPSNSTPCYNQKIALYSIHQAGGRDESWPKSLNQRGKVGLPGDVMRRFANRNSGSALTPSSAATSRKALPEGDDRSSDGRRAYEHRCQLCGQAIARRFQCRRPSDDPRVDIDEATHGEGNSISLTACVSIHRDCARRYHTRLGDRTRPDMLCCNVRLENRA